MTNTEPLTQASDTTEELRLYVEQARGLLRRLQGK